MISHNYYKTGVYTTAVNDTTSTGTSFIRTDSTISSSPTMTRSDLEEEVSRLRRDNKKMFTELQSLEKSALNIRNKNHILQGEVIKLKDTHNLFKQATSFHANVIDIKSTIRQLVKARANSIEFELLLEEETDYLFKCKDKK